MATANPATARRTSRSRTARAEAARRNLAPVPDPEPELTEDQKAYLASLAEFWQDAARVEQARRELLQGDEARLWDLSQFVKRQAEGTQPEDTLEGVLAEAIASQQAKDEAGRPEPTPTPVPAPTPAPESKPKPQPTPKPVATVDLGARPVTYWFPVATLASGEEVRCPHARYGHESEKAAAACIKSVIASKGHRAVA